MDLRDAIELLQSDPDVRLIRVDAHRGTVNDDDDGGQQSRMFAWYPRMVEAVEQHPRLEEIHLINFRFDGRRLFEDHHHGRLHRADHPPDNGNIHLNDNPNHNHNNDQRPSSLLDAIRFWWEGLWRGGHNEPPMQMPPPPPPVLEPWPLPPHHPAHANHRRVAWATNHLFGTVLPHHRTLHRIFLDDCCGIEPRHTESFFDALVKPSNDNGDVNNDDPHHELRALGFASCCLEAESIRHIATALATRGTNVVRIRDLRIGGRTQRWTSTSLQHLCASAAQNRHLARLSLIHITLEEEERRRRRNRNDDDDEDDDDHDDDESENEYVTADMFQNLLRGCGSVDAPIRPTLRHLTLTHEPSCFDPNFFEKLMTMLRTNDVLEALTYHHLVDPLRDLEILHDELLSRYNFTLQHLEVGASMPKELYVSARAQIVQTLNRNNRVWASYDHMRQNGVPEIIVVLDDIVVPRRDHDDDDDATVDDTNHRLLLLPLWPEAIARIHPFPTLLYRFLRKDGNSGNSNAVRLVEYLQQRRSAEGQQQRRSRRRDEDG